MSSDTSAQCRFDIPAGDVEAALAVGPALIRREGVLESSPAERLAFLRALGRHDLTVARALEPHLDALEILSDAGLSASDVGAGADEAWGVYASRSPQLHAEQNGEGWVLDGVKPWCSLADQLGWALVAADTDAGQQLFAVQLTGRAEAGSVGEGSVEAVEQPWVSRGLRAIRSTAVRFSQTTANPVGGPGFYLDRPGFARGGIGVAAVWAGGLDALVASLEASTQQREPDQIALWHLGRLQVLRHVVDVTLADAARALETGRDVAALGDLMARVRTVVADAVEQALEIVGHALGPGPLTGDEEHARRVADLTVYVRQHHAERDVAAIGRARFEELSGRGRPGAQAEA